MKTWVFAVGTNLARDRLRGRKRWPVDAQDQSREVSRRTPTVVSTYRQLNGTSPQGTYEIREHIDFCFTCICKTLPLRAQVAILLKDVYGFKVKEIAVLLELSVPKTQHALRQARQTLTTIFENRCALVSKTGVCHQCSELRGLFNPRQEAQVELAQLDMVKEAEEGADRGRLLRLRTHLVSSIDPLNARGADLHEFMLQRVRTVIGDRQENI